MGEEIDTLVAVIGSDITGFTAGVIEVGIGLDVTAARMIALAGVGSGMADVIRGSVAGIVDSLSGLAGQMIDVSGAAHTMGDAIQAAVGPTAASAEVVRRSSGPAASGIGDLIGAALGGLGDLFGGGRAAGGPVSAGMNYLVGERGPEILRMGGQGGFIQPMNVGGGGGGYNGPESVTVVLQADGFEERIVTKLAAAQRSGRVKAQGK